MGGKGPESTPENSAFGTPVIEVLFSGLPSVSVNPDSRSPRECFLVNEIGAPLASAGPKCGEVVKGPSLCERVFPP